MMRIALPTLLLTMLALPSRRAAAEELTPPPGFRDRSGLTELVFWQGVNGLIAGGTLAYAITGGAVERECDTGDMTGMMEASEACKDAVGRSSGIAALGLAAGIATPLLVTRGKDVRTGDVLLINRATMIGFLHGYIVPFAAGLDNTQTDDRRVLSALTFTGDVLGVAAGTYLASRLDLTPGKVSFVGTLHTAVLLAALSVGNSIPDDVDQDDERIISGISLGLADVALGIGIAYIDRVDIGRRRVFWLDTGGLVGWIGGGGFGALLGGSDERAIAIGSTVGMAAGLVLTYWATSDMEEWRRRYQVGSVAVEFHPPSLRVEPESAASGAPGPGKRISIDALRGRF
jgi:hypothetical protein